MPARVRDEQNTKMLIKESVNFTRMIFSFDNLTHVRTDLIIPHLNLGGTKACTVSGGVKLVTNLTEPGF